MSKVVLVLEETQARHLKEKLEILMRESNHGVDVWLAPGGVFDVTGKDADTDCFLDYDEEAGDSLNSILKMLRKHLPTEEAQK